MAKVYVVVGVFQGMINEVKVFDNFGDAEKRLKSWLTQYGYTIHDSDYVIYQEEVSHSDK